MQAKDEPPRLAGVPRWVEFSWKGNTAKACHLSLYLGLQTDLVNKKRNRDQEGKEVMEERKILPPKEAEAQRGGKQARVM